MRAISQISSRRTPIHARSYATSTDATSSASTRSLLLTSGIALNLLLSSYLIYALTQLSQAQGKLEEHVGFGMDRIDECLNRIDLRNNETTGYFEKVSQKVEQLEAMEKGKNKKK